MNTHETSRQGGLIRNGGASTDEQKLVVQAKSGHSSAFGELYERHQLKIYRSAFRILRNEQDAEDAVQQSFQRAFVNLHRFRGDSAFATWVTRIAINEALMMLRPLRFLKPTTTMSTQLRRSICPTTAQRRNKPSPKKKVAPSSPTPSLSFGTICVPLLCCANSKGCRTPKPLDGSA